MFSWKFISFKLWFAFIAGILLCIYVVLSLLVPKSSISIAEFKQSVEDSGYLFSNENINTNDKIILSYGKAILEDKVEIEFFETTSYYEGTELREEYEDIIKKQIQGQKGISLGVNKYHKYAIENEKEYAVIIQIDNTMIFARVPIDYKNKIDEFVKKIKYVK